MDLAGEHGGAARDATLGVDHPVLRVGMWLGFPRGSRGRSRMKGVMAELRRSEIIEVLRAVPLFANLTGRQLKALAAECSTRTFEPEQLIVTEQEWGQHMVAITAGTAKVVRGSKQIATVGAGDVIGEMSLVDGEPRSASVIADGPVEGLVIYGTTFRKLLAEHPTMVTKLLVAQTARLRALDKQVGLYG